MANLIPKIHTQQNKHLRNSLHSCLKRGSIAQLGEQLPYKQRVGGSSPSTPTKTGRSSRKSIRTILNRDSAITKSQFLLYLFKGTFCVKIHLFLIHRGSVATVVLKNAWILSTKFAI